MIKSLYIHNFRCFENFELELDGLNSALLIGKNGTGKSTLSLVLELLQRIARGTNRLRELVKASDFSRGRSEVPMRFQLKVEIDKKTYDYTLALELPKDFDELRVLEESLIAEGKPVYLREKEHIHLMRTTTNGDNQFQMNRHQIALPSIYEQSRQDPLYLFKTWLSRMLILAPVPSLITGDSEIEVLSPKVSVSDFGAWIAGLLAFLPSAYQPFEQYLKQVMPDFEDIENTTIGTDARTLIVRFKSERTQLQLPFRVLSDGEKCFFIGAAVLAAKKTYSDLFCFWDEPDNHISIFEISPFIMALRRATLRGGQLLMTSHNIEAIRQFSNENTFVFFRESHLEPVRTQVLKDRLKTQDIKGGLEDALLRGDILL